MTTAHEFTLKTLDGRDKKLADYEGRPMLIVNVASKCGLTPQYAGLEKLHEEVPGLAILGVPCNQFGGQEPGSESEIGAFCEKNYGVKFDMFSKVDVNGPNAHPLYRWLTDGGKKPIQWNFGKFLVGKDGALLERFEPTVTPDDPKLVDAIQRALG